MCVMPSRMKSRQIVYYYKTIYILFSDMQDTPPSLDLLASPYSANQGELSKWWQLHAWQRLKMNGC